jgi:dienelactone hydrolase
MGMSLGGYFAPRAAAYEPRIKALIPYDGIYDYNKTLPLMLKPEVLRLLDASGTELDQALEQAMRSDIGLRWRVTNGMWTFQVKSPHEFVRSLRSYTLEDCVEGIRCPTLVLAAEKDHFLEGQPEDLFARLTCEKKFIRFTANVAAASAVPYGPRTSREPSVWPRHLRRAWFGSMTGARFNTSSKRAVSNNPD